MTPTDPWPSARNRMHTEEMETVVSTVCPICHKSIEAFARATDRALKEVNRLEQETRMWRNVALGTVFFSGALILAVVSW